MASGAARIEPNSRLDLHIFLSFVSKSVHLARELPCYFDAESQSRKSEFSQGKTHFSELRKRCRKTIAKRRALAVVRVFSLGKVAEKTAIRSQIAVFPERCFAMRAKGGFPPAKLRF